MRRSLCSTTLLGGAAGLDRRRAAGPDPMNSVTLLGIHIQQGSKCAVLPPRDILATLK
jgi:hypothetical protein